MYNQLSKHRKHFLRYGTCKMQVIQQQRQVNILDLNNKFFQKVTQHFNGSPKVNKQVSPLIKLGVILRWSLPNALNRLNLHVKVLRRGRDPCTRHQARSGCLNAAQGHRDRDRRVHIAQFTVRLLFSKLGQLRIKCEVQLDFIGVFTLRKYMRPRLFVRSRILGFCRHRSSY